MRNSKETLAIIYFNLYHHMYRETTKLSAPLSEIAPFELINAFSL